MTVSGRPGAAALALASALAGAPAALAAQGGATADAGWTLRGYSLSLGAATGSSPFSAGGGSLFERVRLMLSPTLGPFDADVAYDQTLLLRSGLDVTPAGALLGGGSVGEGDWLPIQGTLLDGDHVRLAQRIDRLSLGWRAGSLDVRVGRQPISWATTLLLTPADPFAPFDPSDPFREYRLGVDAARLSVAAGAFTELELVGRLTRGVGPGTARETTLAARAKTTLGGVDLSAWGGWLYGDPAAALGADGTLAGSALRAEGELRPAGHPGGIALRAAGGIDRRFGLAGRDLHLALEYQHDDFGAASPDRLPAVLLSDAAARGELQVLGRDVALAQATWQARPLLGVEAMVLADLRDHSTLVAPAISWSLSDEASLRAGAYLGLGDASSTPPGEPRSEFGPVPTTAYVALSVFF